MTFVFQFIFMSMLVDSAPLKIDIEYTIYCILQNKRTIYNCLSAVK